MRNFRYLVLGKRPALAALLLTVALGVALVAGAGHVARTAGTPREYPIYSVETPDKAVAIGVNCAWDNADIPRLIQILDKYQVTATFFVAGSWCDKYPESVKALYDAGHEIGNHSDTHDDMTKMDRDGILRQIRNSSAKIEAITGKRPALFRTPSGAYNDLVIQTIKAEGLFPIQWDCDSIDYKNPTPEEMQARIFKKLRAGSIMLFHSGAKNTPDALPGIIDGILEKGYRIVPVSQLIYADNYTIDHAGRQRPA